MPRGFSMERIADRSNLLKGAEAIGVGDLFRDGYVSEPPRLSQKGAAE
jgi:hypothetical protein